MGGSCEAEGGQTEEIAGARVKLPGFIGFITDSGMADSNEQMTQEGSVVGH